ncbi:hypothetical protein V8B97DRAFT_2025361 [Scleroderma yunnanense]
MPVYSESLTLAQAKQFSHCDTASINAFPLHAQFNIKATECVEEGLFIVNSMVLGWWPQHCNDICRLLWEDLGNWHSVLRKRACMYGILRNGTDDEMCDGHTTNLAHHTLSSLVIDFFYTGPSSVVQLFPKVFKEEVLRVTVAISATALKIVLDKMALSTKSEVSFRVTTYTPVYLEMLRLMKKCDMSLIHAVKIKLLQVEWAKIGWQAITFRK